MMNDLPAAGSVGEVRSKRIPGREDVPEETRQEPMLSTEDIELMMVLLDACAQRGAFRLSEFTEVGRLSDRITAYLQDAAGRG